MEIKGIYFQVKLMNKYISTKYKNNFLLLNIRININFQSRSVVRNSNKNQTYLTHSPSKKELEKIFTTIGALVAQHN